MAKSKRKTTLAVLRCVIGKPHSKEVIFAKTVGRSVSWVKKVSSNKRTMTMDGALQISKRTGVSVEWLFANDPSAPVVEVDKVTPYTIDSFLETRRKEEFVYLQTDCPPIEPAISGIRTVLQAAAETGYSSMAIDDLWKFYSVMQSRYVCKNT